MKKNSKIYLAGHNGMVGSNLLALLKDRGYTNIIVKNKKELNLINQKEVNDFFDKERPEYVFLAAAKVGGILANNTYKADFIYDNLMIASNVIKTSYDFGVKKLLNLGSSCIYPKFANQPITEESLLTGALEPTNEPYALAKISAIKLCRYFNEQYGTNFISAMPSNLYGFGDNFNLETSHLLPALLRKIYLAKLLMNRDFLSIQKDLIKNKIGFDLDKQLEADTSEPVLKKILNELGIYDGYVKLWGDGSPFRELLYTQDLVEACLMLMENYDYSDIGEFVNIGYGEDFSIKEIAEKIASVVNFTGEIKFDKLKPNGTPKKLLDITKIKKMGWTPKVNLEQGITKLYEWYLV